MPVTPTPAPSGRTPDAARAAGRSIVPANPALPHGALFGTPPLIGGEDASTYDGLLARIAATVAPADVLEEMWVRDVVDLAWEALRLRRLKAMLLTAAAPEGLVAALTRAIGSDAAGALAQAWAAGGRRAARRVDAALARAGLTRDAVTAHALALRIDQVERIDAMIAHAEDRRIAALREIELHRAVLADALREALAGENAGGDEDDDARSARIRDH